jgi:hypothetical protein
MINLIEMNIRKIIKVVERSIDTGSEKGEKPTVFTLASLPVHSRFSPAQYKLKIKVEKSSKKLIGKGAANSKSSRAPPEF